MTSSTWAVPGATSVSGLAAATPTTSLKVLLQLAGGRRYPALATLRAAVEEAGYQLADPS